MEKREVGLFEGVKGIYDELDKQGALNSVKEKLFDKARIPVATAALMTGRAKDQIKEVVPDISVGTKLGGNTGFYADASAGASLDKGLTSNLEAGYKGNIDAKVDTKGFEVSKRFGGENNNVNVNLAKRFDGDTDVNVEGIKQLNKYLKAKAFAGSDGDYGASVGFDIPL